MVQGAFPSPGRPPPEMSVNDGECDIIHSHERNFRTDEGEIVLDVLGFASADEFYADAEL